MATLRPTSEWGSNGWGAIPWGGNFPSVGGNQTVDPTAIASQQAMGTPYIVIPGIGAGHAPSQQSFGSPTMMGGTVIVYPATIPSPRAIGNPNLSGPMTPTAIPSQQSFGTPFIDAIWTLHPTAIPSQQSFGTVSLNVGSQQVAPTAIASQQSFGTVKITGGPSPIRATSIASQQAFGIPKLIGGSGVLTVTTGGSVYLGTVLSNGGSDTSAPVTYESSNPPTITSQTLGRWTLNVDLFDTTGLYAPTRGQTIVLTEGGQTLFAGCIQTVGRQRLMGTSQAIIYHVLATDKSGICDRRVVKPTTFPSGSDVAQVILTIVATSLNGEGITTLPSSVPIGGLGTLTSDLITNYDSVTDVFNSLATQSGTIWYVDPTGVLWFNSFDNLPAAPWNLVENGGNFRSLLVEETNVGYANVIYVVSNLSTIPGSGSGGGGNGTGSTTESYVATPGNIGVYSIDLYGDGTEWAIGINTTQPIGTLYSITVNGTPQTVVEESQWNGQEPTSPPDYGPWFWLSAATTVTASLVGTGGLPQGSTIVINYTPYTSNTQASLGEALAPVDPATGGTLGTCGSGIYELAIQVQNISSVDDLNAIAAAELVKRNGLPVKITFQTDKPGLQPGQIITVDIPNLFLNNVPFLIIYAQGIAASGPLEFGSRFQWEIQAQTSTDPGNWYQWFANLLTNAGNPLPIYQYEDASFVLAPGSSLAGGMVATNPYLVKRTGQLVFIYAAAQTPPTNQNLNINFYVNGNFVGQVTIPGGSGSNQPYTYAFPTTNPLWVFNTATENDVVTIGVAYVVTGANPTPASNVSAYLRWQI